MGGMVNEDLYSNPRQLKHSLSPQYRPQDLLSSSWASSLASGLSSIDCTIYFWANKEKQICCPNKPEDIYTLTAAAQADKIRAKY